MFTYSHEDGTRAFGMDDDVPARVKALRRARIMELQQSIVERRRQAEVGTTVRIMVDGPSADSPLVWTARLEGQAPDIDSVVVLTDCDPSTLTPGALVDARIVGATGYDLVAQPLPA